MDSTNRLASLRSLISPLQAIWLLGLLLAACAPFPTAPPLPTPQQIRLAYTPAMSGWQPAIAACAAQLPEVAVSLHPAAWPGADPTVYDLLLQAAEPPEQFNGYAADLGRIELIFVQSGELPPVEWSQADLLQAYTHSGPPQTQLLTYAPESELAAPFLAILPAGSSLTPEAILAADPQSMFAQLSQNPGAVGILPVDFIQPGLQALPGLPTFTLPQVALTAAEPEGALRVLVACLQSSLPTP